MGVPAQRVRDLNASSSVTSDGLAEWIASGDVRTLVGRRIFTRVAAVADRPALLLIHGYPTSSHDWHAVWDALSARYSLYALDLLGFGRSEKPRRSNYAMGEQADLCQALLQVHAIRSVHVLAHD
jgi:pimeloyl-ACP methyl ester carboxylesterase